MAEPHVVTAIRAKRSEISGYVTDLERKLARHGASLANLAATILPAERTARPTRLPVQVERCRGVLRGAQRQHVDYRVTDRTADKLLS
jgi:hypothetical protein